MSHLRRTNKVVMADMKFLAERFKTFYLFVDVVKGGLIGLFGGLNEFLSIFIGTR